MNRKLFVLVIVCVGALSQVQSDSSGPRKLSTSCSIGDPVQLVTEYYSCIEDTTKAVDTKIAEGPWNAETGLQAFCDGFHQVLHKCVKKFVRCAEPRRLANKIFQLLEEIHEFVCGASGLPARPSTQVLILALVFIAASSIKALAFDLN